MRYFIFAVYVLMQLMAVANGDSIRVAANEILILRDTIIAPDQDTVLYIDTGKYKIRKNPYRTSTDFYQKMKEKTGQNRITSRIFDLLYVNKNARTEIATNKYRTSNTPFIPYEGLRIKNIRIRHVDILEGSVSDTLRAASSTIAQLANQAHINTWNTVIKNNLLIKKGETVDAYQMADNERIIRRLRFIEDVKIYIKPLNNDAAEVIVVVKDRFSWGTDLTFRNTEQLSFQIFNRNIAGWGKYANATGFYNSNYQPTTGYDLRVGGQNIDQTITNWELHHTNFANLQSWGVNLQKEFVAPEVKYGGGIDIRSVKDSTMWLDGELSRSSYYHLNYQDIWLGRSILLPSGSERKNLVFSGRWLNHSFQRQPFVSPDSNFIYYNRQLILGEVSLSSQKFLKTNYIASFGISEDIPLGYRFSFISGRDFNEFNAQDYFGFQFYWSFYLKNVGYILMNQEVGAFSQNRLKQGVFKTRLDYFSPLLTSGRYHLRNFLRIALTHGIHQPDHQYISLENRIRDIEGDQLTGNAIITLGIESVLYTPWYFYGFRFTPFVYFNIGETWDNRNVPYSYGHHGVGGGIRVRNESLVFNTLEVRLTHFPGLPQATRSMYVSFSTSLPISFENVFRYKPTLVPFR